MKKLIILVLLFVILGVIFLAFTFFRKKQEAPPNGMLTPTIVQTNTIQLENAVPVNNATNVARNQDVIFTFSEPVTANDLQILVGPNTGHALLFRGKTVVVRPVPLWDEGTPYRVSIQYANPTQIPDGINFTTVGKPVEKLPDTGPNPTAVKESEDIQLETSPDVYLSNYTPFETQKFRITSAYKATPTGHFAFTVVTKGEASLEVIKSEVEAWARGHGLTETQVNSLDISYE